jgi:outer membrane protein insertion porin family/translocation and assembly module TamA
MSRVRAIRIALVPLLFVLSGCQEEQAGIQVRALNFSGNRAVSTSQLRSVLATATSARLPWGEREYFSREEFEADLKRIVAFYRDRGFPNARVTSFDTKLSDDQRSVRLSIVIDEGEPVRVEQIVMEGLDTLPTDHQQELERRFPLKVGAPLDRALLQSGREAIVDELKDHGFPSPEVTFAESNGSSDLSRIVTFTARPGSVAYVGNIQIQGMSSVSRRIVARQLTFRPGQLFQQSKLRESQRRLYSMELFNFVNIEALNEGTPQASPEEGAAQRVSTRVTVTEGKHRRVNFGVGYGSEEKARGEVDWRHVNFFGGARTAGVQARYSSLDRGVRLNFKQPYFLGPRYSMGMSAQAWFADEPAYELTTTGGRVTVTREQTRGRSVLAPRQTTTLALTYANEWEEYTIDEAYRTDPNNRDDFIALGLDPDTGSGSGRLSALILDAGLNTTDNLLDAKKGYVAILHLETAGNWLGGDFDYREASAEGRYFLALGSRAVVALRARGGGIDAKADAIVPFFKRYFLGGSTNLRGWGRFEVSPLLDGLPIGGLTFTNFSTELRVPIVGKVGGVLFMDGGNVWENSWDFNLNDLRYDAGVGIRYNTPVGPLRFDVGWQLNPIPGLLVNNEPQKRPLRLHFSIGQAF